MNTFRLFESQTLRRASSACAAVLAAAVSPSLPAYANNVTPPPVPTSIQVPEGHKAFLVGHGVGTQNYVCLPSGAGFAFVLFTPQATLFNRGDKQLTTHFFGPNPDEKGTIRAAWQHSRDTSTVWARGAAPPSFDPAFVAPGSVPWLLLEIVGAEDGPTGGDALSATTTFIQRVNTAGGLAPSTGCSQASDVGQTRFVPYKADYFFFEKAD